MCLYGCEDGYNFVTDNKCNTTCAEGSYGTNCSLPCSAFCLNSRRCHHLNGTCIDGCADGYEFVTDKTCNTPCATGLYGHICSSTCSAFCRNNRSCHHVNGTCLNGCEDGYNFVTDNKCNTTCAEGSYGTNCSLHCSAFCLNSRRCHHINGTCIDGCADGYAFVTDKTCNTPCGHRRYGRDCSSICSDYCHNNQSCHHINGTCPKGCEDGYDFKQNETCNTICKNRTFGKNCSMNCNCDECHHVNGSCAMFKQQCDTGFKMDKDICQQNIEASSKPSSSSTGAIGGGVAAAVAFTIVIIIAVVFYKRRRMNNNGDNREFVNDIAMFSPTEPQSTVKSDQQLNLKTDLRGNIYANAKDIQSDYYGFNAFATGIQLHELWTYIRDKDRIDSTYFDDEFKKLPAGLIRKHDVASAACNKGKTRYKDLYAYDDSRVVLTNACPDDSDYINASYIHGFDKLKKFIASQGPTQKMISDFWRMIWQQKVEKIVMLTNLIELGTLKCLQYWPEDINGECKHGGVLIKYAGIKETFDYKIRSLEITMDGETRRLNQFHFMSWPDKDVPDTTWCLVDFWRAVAKFDDTNTSPILVHCSAGVGRSGTFIALDNLIAQAQIENCVRPLHVVEALRQQRVNMVQTKEQYKYLHEALAEALLIGTHHWVTRQFESVYNFMIGKDIETSKTRIEQQFELITKSANYARGQSAVIATGLVNDHIGTQNEAMIIKATETKPQCIVLSALGESRAFIALTSLHDNTAENVWSLVEKQGCKTMIEFSNRSEGSHKADTYHGQKEGGRFGRYYVNLTEERNDRGFEERTYSYKEDTKGSSLKTFKQFYMPGMNKDPERQSMLDLIEAILTWQGQLSTDTPILIKDGSNFHRSGLVVVLLSEICRIVTHDGQINLVETVVSMKHQEKHIIHSAAQLRICYDAILDYVQKPGIYQNF
ncbi:receptor-type tyrosine-protein phosphatase epsilon-like isoform X4 [Dreissena polymorpha]|uniref:receptor-type tyrosine-protein phosphatase epsilon-like isoform X4 n=1 Tax=Dreissena polymorpha TaxID=45954 RepID=UPI0022643854|nr:receptor-type tyrosine-protein phosphatase epsilon-like isoform X4 [Dreissena polymorpha]